MNAEDVGFEKHVTDRTVVVSLIEVGDQWSRAMRRQRPASSKWQWQQASLLEEIVERSGREAYSITLVEPRHHTIVDTCRQIWRLTRRPICHRVIALAARPSDRWMPALWEAGAIAGCHSAANIAPVIEIIDRFVDSLPALELTLEQALIQRLPWTPVDIRPENRKEPIS